MCIKVREQSGQGSLALVVSESLSPPADWRDGPAVDGAGEFVGGSIGELVDGSEDA